MLNGSDRKNKIKNKCERLYFETNSLPSALNIGDKQKVFSIIPSNCFVTTHTLKNDIGKKKSLAGFTNERICNNEILLIYVLMFFQMVDSDIYLFFKSN